jgi:hypothetical protein
MNVDETWYDVKLLTAADITRKLDLIVKHPDGACVYIRGFMPYSDAAVCDVFNRLRGRVVAWHPACDARQAYEARKS